MNTLIVRTLVLLFLIVTASQAQEPRLINYQGQVAVGGVNFEGSGQFKFAIGNAGGTTSYWSNDGTSNAGSEPAEAVMLTVTDGQYAVLLGDTTLPNMAAIPADVFENANVFLRIWFNDGANGSQLLTPDQRLQMDCATTTADAWQQRNVEGRSPPGRVHHSTVWTGSDMIVWGGAVPNNTGDRYNPAENMWTAVSTDGAPAHRYYHTAVWTGSEMIVWGGYRGGPGGHYNDGGRYNPATDSWTPVSTVGAPSGRRDHTAVWTGSEMIVWGGNSTSSNVGGRYNPATDSWVTMSATGAPAGREYHEAVWTGSEMIVWGGTLPWNNGYTYLNTGGRYNPVQNTWTEVNTTSAPIPRFAHTMVWTGREMIVWGGHDGSKRFGDGGRYDPAENSWTEVNPTDAPFARAYHSGVWTGSEMIVWGGNDGSIDLNTGGRYNPAANRWDAVTTAGAPAARRDHSAVWTGSEMIVWSGIVGGIVSGSSFNFSYTPDCGAFRITSAVLKSGNLILSFPTVTGRTYTLWRSDTLAGGAWTDTGLAALTGTGATLTFTVPAPTAGVLKRFFRVQADP